MPTGGFLRTNFRRTGQQPITAIGGIYPFTSYAGVQGIGTGTGTNMPFGGLIMGSVNLTSGDASALGYYAGASNLMVISAYGAMSGWFGAGAYTSGYRILPVAFIPRIMAGITNASSPSGAGGGPFIWASMSVPGDSTFGVLVAASTLSAVPACYSLVDFRWVGFICSSP
jgi:hypothetical protein